MIPSANRPGNASVAFLLTAGAALAVYGLTLAPDLTWAHHGGDGGELITAAMTLGVPHPPGYPTYVVVGRLVGLLPLEPVAVRFHLLSAVAAALATGLLAATAARWLARRGDDARRNLPGAVGAGLAVAFSPLVWSRAVIAEVYALNLLAVSACLWVALARPDGPRRVTSAGFLLGLAVTTHPTSVLLAPLLLSRTARSRWPRLLAGTALGLLPLALPPLFAQGASPIVWGEPSTLAGWWWLVSGRIYQPNALSAPVLDRLSTWIPAALAQFAWLGWLLVPAGRPERLGRAAALLGLTATAYAVFALGYDTPDAASLALPALLCVGLLLAFGLRRLGPSALALPVLLLGLHFGSVSLRGDDVLRQHALQALASAPPGAILVTPGDPTVFAIWYFHEVEGARPDVTIVDEHLFAFDWYRRRLARLEPSLPVPAADNLAALLADAGRPIYAIDLTTPIPPRCPP